MGYSPWGREESDMTERLHFHFSFSCIGEGNGNPLQCSCLENPRDGRAWWAAVYGVTQSRTRLKLLSSSKHTIIKTVWYWHKNIYGPKEQPKKPRNNPHTDGQLVFNKGDKTIQWRKDSLFRKWCLESQAAESVKLEHFFTPYTKVKSK